MVSKTLKARNLMRKTNKNDNQDSRADAQDEKPMLDPGGERSESQKIDDTRTRLPADPWGNSTSTDAGRQDIFQRKPTLMSEKISRIALHGSSSVTGKEMHGQAQPEMPSRAENASPEYRRQAEIHSRFVEHVDADSEPVVEDQTRPQGLNDDVLKQKLLEAFEKEQQMVARIKNLEAQLQQQSQRCTELDRAWKKSTTALTQLQRQEPLHKVDDQALQGLYRELVFDVANWAATFCRIDQPRIVDEKLPHLQRLSPAYPVYLQDRPLRPFFVQSLLMRLLVTDVLSFQHENGLWWAGRHVKLLRRLQKDLMPAHPDDIPELLVDGSLSPLEVREYAEWKSKTALFIMSRVKKTEVELAISRIVSTMKKSLYMYVHASNDAVWSELQEIVGKAVRLDEEMSKSRALWTVSCWGEEGFPKLVFDELTMETAAGFEAGRPGMSVELIVAPPLVKTGTADGAAFDRTSYLCKWIVMCAESRKKM